MKCALAYAGLRELGYNRFFTDLFVDGSAAVQVLGGHGLDDLAAVMAERPAFAVDAAYLDTYNSGATHPEQRQSLALLRAGKAHAIVTGQQVGAFGGPVLVFWKAAAAIVTARRLSKKTGRPVVPVFWIADEDHDVEELRPVSLPLSGGFLSEKVQSSSILHGTPAGASVPDSDQLEGLKTRMLTLVRNPEDQADASAWLPGVGESFENWFVRMVHTVFGPYGMVVAGSRRPEAKRLAGALFSASIRREEQARVALEQRNAYMAAHYHVQAQPAPFNLFFLDDNGARHRFEKSEGGYRSAGREQSVEAWAELASSHPDRFSPNVFLRPLLQDLLLPTVAYCGGPGEAAYHAQLAVLYPVLDLKKPAFLPRFTGTILDAADTRTLADSGLQLSDFLRRPEEIERLWLERNGNTVDHAPYTDALTGIKKILDDLKPGVAAWDPTLVASVDRMEAGLRNEFERLEQKLDRAAKTREETRLGRVRRLKSVAAPQEGLQERVVSLSWLRLRFGPGVFDALLTALEHSARPDQHHICTVEFDAGG